MELHKAEELTKQLMQEHGVEGYTFSFMRQKKSRFNRAGQCNWKNKTIQLQPLFVELNEEPLVRNTILHEIAHALRPRHGHNKFWRQTAQAIGCTGVRCYGKDVIREKK